MIKRCCLFGPVKVTRCCLKSQETNVANAIDIGWELKSIILYKHIYSMENAGTSGAQGVSGM